jgi:uncharacterized protein YkwD
VRRLRFALSTLRGGRKVSLVLVRRGGRWPSAVPLIVLVAACLAPLPVAVATGLVRSPGDERTETAGGERAADRADADGRALVGDVPLGGVVAGMDDPGAGDPAFGDDAGQPTTVPGASSTTDPSGLPTPSAPPPTEDPAPAPPTTAPPPPDTPVPTVSTPPPSTRVAALSLAEQVVALANTDRTALAGCDPLVIDPRLVSVAQAHSEDMAANSYFSHTSLDGRSFGDRLGSAGYSGGGENIAQGQRSAAAVHDAWMRSDGHRANILNCSFTAVGVGVETTTWTWTQDFGA